MWRSRLRYGFRGGDVERGLPCAFEKHASATGESARGVVLRDMVHGQEVLTQNDVTAGGRLEQRETNDCLKLTRRDGGYNVLVGGALLAKPANAPFGLAGVHFQPLLRCDAGVEA